MHLMALLLVAAAVTAVWSLFATRLTHWRVAPALVLAIAGAATAQVSKVELSTALALPITERIIEMILALLLFVDATEVKGGLLGHDRRGALKLLLIGLPLSLVAATALGAFLFPGVGLAILVLLACAVMPTDLSANGSLFRNQAVPRRVGRLLNVESGYNDGIVAPIFVCALVLIEHTSGEREFWDAVGEGIYSTSVAIGIGGAIGFVAAFAGNRALAHSLTSTRALGITVIMVALLAYGGAVLLEGNGFVSAFVCGITYRAARTVQELGGTELEFVEDVTLLCNVVMWFGFGLLIDYFVGPRMGGVAGVHLRARRSYSSARRSSHARRSPVAPTLGVRRHWSRFSVREARPRSCLAFSPGLRFLTTCLTRPRSRCLLWPGQWC